MPGTETYEPVIFTSDITARAAVTGIYGKMLSQNGLFSGNTRSLTVLGALSADELESYSTEAIPREFYGNAISPANAAIETALWNEAYQHIYAANAVLEGLERSNGVTPATKVQLQGEALFIRALCHFCLVNLFGNVPYLTTTNYKENIVQARMPGEKVYQQLIQDLQASQARFDELPGLGQNYVYVTGERVRPNRWAAAALLARAYLYTGRWEQAEALASAVISQTNTYSLDSLSGVFLKNSREAIWQLEPNNAEGFNTWEGKNFILGTAPGSGENNSTVLSGHLLQAFENGDQRRAAWVDSVIVDNTVYYFPAKYKVQTGVEQKEYSMVLRLAEQYLVRAEARARMGDVSGARADIDSVRRRAGLSSTTAGNPTALLAAIAQERRVELFTEWGHRWLDLKRTGTANAVLSMVKSPGWQPADTLYPIPQRELSLNKNLTQNPGYH
ncbi:RagB/SusD family nutrient uptake outer membrane protein [Chitinophaga japonensis]